MTATPDSFSSVELAKLLENAPQDIVDRVLNPENETSADKQQRLTKIAENCIQDVTDPLNGAEAALVHKIILHILVDHMVEWHSKVSHHLIRDGEAGPAIGWARDAGKFQAIANILITIECGDDDFTCITK